MANSTEKSSRGRLAQKMDALVTSLLIERSSEVSSDTLPWQKAMNLWILNFLALRSGVTTWANEETHNVTLGRKLRPTLRSKD